MPAITPMFMIVALLLGGVGGATVVYVVTNPTPPDWQSQIISRIALSGAPNTYTLNKISFVYEGNYHSEIRNLMSGNQSYDFGMWNVFTDQGSAVEGGTNFHVMTIELTDAGKGPYGVEVFFLAPPQAYTFVYGSTTISFSIYVAQFTVDRTTFAFLHQT